MSKEVTNDLIIQLISLSKVQQDNMDRLITLVVDLQYRIEELEGVNENLQ